MTSYVELLNDGMVDIDEAPLGHFDYNETNGGVDVGGDDDEEEEEVEVEEIKRPRAVNYTVVEDEALIKAWENISLDSIHGQTGKRYWQRVEDKFFQLMPRNGTTVPRTFRSLQGHWDAIKMACSRWSGCLEQVHNAPPSGTNEADWVRCACIALH